MNLVKRHELWDPLDVMPDFRREIDRLFHRSLYKKNGWEKTFKPEIDIAEQKDNFIVKADLPGIKKEDLDIKVEGRFLTLKGERKEEKETKEQRKQFEIQRVELLDF